MDISALSHSPGYLSSFPSSADAGGQQPRVVSGLSPDISPANNQRQDALAIFQRTLEMGYEKLQAQQGKGNTQQTDNVRKFATFEPLSAEKVANNILGFIERRLKMDAADGATPEALQARLDAGLAGFKKGFAEASEKLKALSLLSPQVQQDIGQTYDKVLEGVEQLRQKLLDDTLVKTSPSVPAKAVQNTQKNALAALANSEYQYASANSFRFTLTTAEGDKVIINASSTRAFGADYQYASANNGVSVESMNASYSASSNFSFSVEGDLNESELGAVNELLAQVNDLANQFFKGDLDTAFQQALSLGYDQEQITAFSLNLTQVEVQRVSTAYRQFEPAGLSNNDLADRLLPLGHFVRDLLQALDTASVFDQPRELLNQLSTSMIAPNGENSEQPAQRLNEFMKTLMDSVNVA